MISKYPRGSEWRKWDLHIHTPASFHWNDGITFSEMTDQEINDAYKRIVEKINSSDVSVFAIMDYWTFDGYLGLRSFLNDNPDISCTKTILPGIELRIEAPTDFRLNIHAILSDELTAQNLSDFKNSLKIFSADKIISNEAFISVAKSFDKSKAAKHGFKDPEFLSDEDLLNLGQKTAVITIASLNDALINISEGKCIIALPYDTSDGLEKLNWEEHPLHDNYFMQKAHIFESRTPDNVDLFLGIKNTKNEKYFNNFLKTIGGKAKPVFSGSDAHKIDDYGKFPGSRITWIKADPTFEGLKQIIHEPASRVFIGENPPKLKIVEENKDKFITQIKVITKQKENEWFDDVDEIPINIDLVSIIGNKGSGKSALADIIGMSGNANVDKKQFSFLKSEKFLQLSESEKYAAQIRFYDGFENEKEFPKPEHIQVDNSKVVYLSQSFVQELCEDLNVSRLQSEIDRVIFSHIPREEQQSTDSLLELLKIRTKVIDSDLMQEKSRLEEINQSIEGYEVELKEENVTKIKNKHDDKERFLKTIEEYKPKEVEKPEETADSDSDSKKELISFQAKERTLKEDLDKLQLNLDELIKDKQQIELTKGKLESFGRNYEDIRKELHDNYITEKYKIDINKLINLSIDLADLDSIDEQLTKNINITKTEREGIVSELSKIEIEIKRISDTLSSKDREFQRYIEDLKNWEKKKKDILGDDNTPDTIEYLKAKLFRINEVVPNTLKTFKENRKICASEILKLKIKKKDLLPSMYHHAKVYAEGQAKEFGLGSMEFIAFDSKLKFPFNFDDKFLDLINQNRRGTFYGVEEGREIFNEVIKQIDKDDINSLLSLPDTLIELLNNNHSDGKDNSTTVDLDTQLRSVSRSRLYNYLYSFDYLDTSFDITYAGGRIENLSPGERGTLLLIFYLLIDVDLRPIIIDQPEENLDNETVFQKLVPFIKKAKTKRQIIIVTHNPNLAIVCDSEQIIHAKMDKDNKNVVSYESGSIEFFDIRQKALDILEGTEPAFRNRKDKYNII